MRSQAQHCAVMHRNLVPGLSVEQMQAAIAEGEGGMGAGAIEAGGDDMGAKLRYGATGFQEFIEISHDRLCAELRRPGQGGGRSKGKEGKEALLF